MVRVYLPMVLLGHRRLSDRQIIGGDGGAQNFLQLFALGAELRALDDEAAIVERQADGFGGEQFTKTQLARFQGQRQRDRSALDQIFLHAGDDFLGAAELNQGDIFDRLKTIFLQHVARDEVGKGAETRDADGFAFERATLVIGAVVKKEVWPVSYWQPTITRSAPARLASTTAPAAE